MCVVCDKSQMVEDPSQHMVVAIAEHAKGGYLLIVTQDSSPEETGPESVSMQIKYCPWCGNDIDVNRKSLAALNEWASKDTMK